MNSARCTAELAAMSKNTRPTTPKRPKKPKTSSLGAKLDIGGSLAEAANDKLVAMIPTLEWTADGVRFLDQTRLPLEETYVLARTHVDVADVIRTMVVRGAPAIGVAAAMGVALAAKNFSAEDLTLGEMHKQLEQEVIPLL